MENNSIIKMIQLVLDNPANECMSTTSRDLLKTAITSLGLTIKTEASNFLLTHKIYGDTNAQYLYIVNIKEHSLLWAANNEGDLMDLLSIQYDLDSDQLELVTITEIAKNLS